MDIIMKEKKQYVKYLCITRYAMEKNYTYNSSIEAHISVNQKFTYCFKYFRWQDRLGYPEYIMMQK